MKIWTEIIIAMALLAIAWIPAVVAQQINGPPLLRSNTANKITNVRLRALNSEDDDERQRELERGLIDRDPQSGCDIFLGNSSFSGARSSVDRDVIVVGDIINFCRY
ncbi:MAG: hypothetical protein ACR2RL_06760 [Gammaproteobacteria bacterium]